MTSTEHLRTADDWRLAWRARLPDIDPVLADIDRSTVLAGASWNGDTFVNLRIGLDRLLAALPRRSLVSNYTWILEPSAYDFITEPLYQYLVLCTVSGLSTHAPLSDQPDNVFADISARMTSLPSLERTFSEPSGAATSRGWVTVPYVWDDLMQLMFAGWVRTYDQTESVSLPALAQRITESTERADKRFSTAVSEWKGILAKSLVGVSSVPLDRQSALLAQVCTELSLFKGAAVHQHGSNRPTVSNTLTHLSMAMTVAHEVGHIVDQRIDPLLQWTPDELLRRERQADNLAMAAVWQGGDVLMSHCTPEHTQSMLWQCTGIGFFSALVMREYALRAADRIGFSLTNRERWGHSSKQSRPFAIDGTTGTAQQRRWLKTLTAASRMN